HGARGDVVDDVGPCAGVLRTGHRHVHQSDPQAGRGILHRNGWGRLCQDRVGGHAAHQGNRGEEVTRQARGLQRTEVVIVPV
ncbi:MAG: hypothetical protein JWQ67_2881, partial [Marmoricola sp.]|nr:hypothetical protein [Marmoricola sp.]